MTVFTPEEHERLSRIRDGKPGYPVSAIVFLAKMLLKFDRGNTMTKPGHQEIGPTPAEIDQRRLAIQAAWSEKEERSRRTGSSIETPYEVPGIEKMPPMTSEAAEEVDDVSLQRKEI